MKQLGLKKFKCELMGKEKPKKDLMSESKIMEGVLSEYLPGSGEQSGPERAETKTERSGRCECHSPRER